MELVASLLSLHRAWAWVMIVGNGLAGVWAIVAIKHARLRTRALWWFTTFVEIAVFVQVILGVLIMQTEDREPSSFHMFYGFVAMITVGIYYSYRDQLRHHLYWLYGFGGLFLMGLGIRALLKSS